MTDKTHHDFTILVVEDERPLMEAISMKMEHVGLNAVTARTASQAISYLSELKKVDAIWLDHYLLGTESGLDFLAKIKAADSVWQHLPVFVVSNTASNDKVQAYIRFGVNKYYVKSNFRLDEIIQDIINFLLEEKKE